MISLRAYSALKSTHNFKLLFDPNYNLFTGKQYIHIIRMEMYHRLSSIHDILRIGLLLCIIT